MLLGNLHPSVYCGVSQGMKFLIFIFHRSRLSVITVYYEALAGDSVEILAADESSGTLLGYLRHLGVLGK